MLYQYKSWAYVIIWIINVTEEITAAMAIENNKIPMIADKHGANKAIAKKKVIKLKVKRLTQKRNTDGIQLIKNKNALSAKPSGPKIKSPTKAPIQYENNKSIISKPYPIDKRKYIATVTAIATIIAIIYLTLLIIITFYKTKIS